jgi:hypothetical protein
VRLRDHPRKRRQHRQAECHQGHYDTPIH